jgi:hypothetical protein
MNQMKNSNLKETLFCFVAWLNKSFGIATQAPRKKIENVIQWKLLNEISLVQG